MASLLPRILVRPVATLSSSSCLLPPPPPPPLPSSTSMTNITHTTITDIAMCISRQTPHQPTDTRSAPPLPDCPCSDLRLLMQLPFRAPLSARRRRGAGRLAGSGAGARGREAQQEGSTAMMSGVGGRGGQAGVRDGGGHPGEAGTRGIRMALLPSPERSGGQGGVGGRGAGARTGGVRGERRPSRRGS